jgi:excisionase family DNA binding protein
MIAERRRAMNALLEKPGTVVPSEQDTATATESSRILSKVVPDGDLQIQLDDGQKLKLPGGAARLLSYLLTEMSHGNAVTMIPIHAELTTQEAADYLNVSRPYLVGLLEANKLKFRKVGTHRRIKFSDLQAYKEQSDREQNDALDDLAAEAQELHLGY